MAASLFILCGRAAPFKILSLQAWGLRSLPSAVSLCTKPEDSKKVSKKNESGSITNTKADTAQKLSDEDLRKFLARKTLVAFPQRANHPSLEGDPVFSFTRHLNKKPADEESSSSSSSESDSSSDSDDEEEDDNFKNIVKTKVSFPRRDPIFSDDSAMNANKTSEKYFSQEQVKSKHPVKVPHNLKTTETPNNQDKFYQTADDKLSKTDLVKPAIKLSPKERPLDCTGVGTKIVENRTSAEVTSKQFVASVPETASTILPLTKPMLHQSVVQNLISLQEKESIANEVQKTEIQRTAAVLQEVLDDGIPVAETTEKGETFVEEGIQSEQPSILQETKPPVETSQEPFDISTYKNLQHHEYTPYTFVDYDVLLSELRLPQPSSGRLSPRH